MINMVRRAFETIRRTLPATRDNQPLTNEEN